MTRKTCVPDTLFPEYTAGMPAMQHLFSEKRSMVEEATFFPAPKILPVPNMTAFSLEGEHERPPRPLNEESPPFSPAVPYHRVGCLHGTRNTRSRLPLAKRSRTLYSEANFAVLEFS